MLVVGDLMLDRFLWGRVSRISPEAPVPVVDITQESSYPGGAANVARNLRPFCRSVVVAGIAGADAEGIELAERLREEGIDTDCLIIDPDRPTTVKTRVIARQQQMVRFDRERRGRLSQQVLERALDSIAKMLPEVDAVIFEDYGKGFLTQELVDGVTALAHRSGCVTTVDPNPTNPLDWSGAFCVKPNRSEAFAAAGVHSGEPADNPLEDGPLLDVASRLVEKWRVHSLLITLGEHGMLLFEKGQPPYHTPTKAREVYDVSGAGDTAIALFTLALAAGANMREAAEIANHASGIVVAKLGTATLTAEELIESFRMEDPS